MEEDNADGEESESDQECVPSEDERGFEHQFGGDQEGTNGGE